MKAEIFKLNDGSLGLSCGEDGMLTDLVFAQGAMEGDPALEKQRAILEEIVARLTKEKSKP